MRLFLTILLFIPAVCFADHGKGRYMDITGRTVLFAGRYITYGTHSGDISITQAVASPALGASDTLALTGTFNSANYNTMSGSDSTHQVVIDRRGASFSASTFQPMFNYDLHFVKFLGGYFGNWFGTEFWSYKNNDIVFESVRYINSRGAYKNAPFQQWDDPYQSTYSMQFDGTPNRTFYNIKFLKCRLEGTYGVELIKFGSNWGSSPEIKRSIVRDIIFDTDTLGPTDGNSSDCITGTGARALFKNCYFHAIGLSGNSHLAGVQWYGSIDMHDNIMDSSYASMARIYPLGWTGLPGYRSDTVTLYNNLIKGSRSYSAFEINVTSSNIGNRTSANGFEFIPSDIQYNTIDSTTCYSYNDQGGGNHRWHGRVVDLVGGVDSPTVANNVIFRPEQDSATASWTTDSSTHSGFFYSEVGSPATHFVLRNNYSARWSTGKVQDSVNYIPTASSPVRGGGLAVSYRTVDHFGTAVSGNDQDKGWAQYVAAVSPPSCVTNITPANLTSVGGQTVASLTWNTASGADSYDVYVYLNGGSAGSPVNVAGTSMTATGLSVNYTYRYYVVPKNTGGSASGCATNYTIFSTTTITNPTRIRTLTVKRKGT